MAVKGGDPINGLEGRCQGGERGREIETLKSPGRMGVQQRPGLGRRRRPCCQEELERERARAESGRLRPLRRAAS